MIPILFHLGPLTVYSFGMMMALGFLAADYVIRLECKRRGFDPEYSSSIVITAAVAGIVGSRIYAIMDDLPTYLADPKSMIFSGSGFVFYGGMIGGILGAYLVSRWYRISFAVTMDMCAPALAIGQAIGRIGCQLAGDGDWGLPSTLPWAMAYPKAIVGWNSETVLKLDDHNHLVSGFFSGVRVHPAPIYETILYLGVFAILWSMRKRSQPAGHLIYWYMVLAGAARFLVEFVRVNPRVFYSLSEAQLIAIAMMIVGAIALALTAKRNPTAKDRPTANDRRPEQHDNHPAQTDNPPAKDALRA
jgi:phosphatidylglycerol:prolipoprotein diacylglycerol transferase